jgi:hypothetical protein
VQRRAALHEVRPDGGQGFSLEADFLADAVTDAAQVAEADAVDGQQLPRVVDGHRFEHVLRFDAVAQLGHVGAGGGQAGDGFERVGRLLAGRRAGLEDPAPVAQHLFGVVEALERIAVQRFGEEGGETVAQQGVETLAGQRGFAIEHRGCVLPSPQRGGTPVTISCRVTASAKRSA